MRTLALAFLAILIFAVAKDASASCYPPAGPSRTSDGIGITFHSYAYGYRLCIYTFGDEPHNICHRCKSGYWHKCTTYAWEPEPFNKCSPDEAKPYLNGVVQGAASGESARKNLLGDMLDGHQGAQGKIDNRNTELSNQVRKDHSDLARKVINQARKNLQQSVEKHLNQRTVSSGTSASGSDASRCAELEQQIAQEIGRRAGNAVGHCNEAKDMLGMLTYAKDNLSRYGCYNGEYDQGISNHRSHISNHC